MTDCRHCIAALAIALIAIGCGQRHEAHRPPARDIILVTIDTLRADSVGFAGNTRVKTPFLDSLAARGMVFTNAHAHNVITLPSHVNILTGLYPFQHGVRENAGFKLDPKHETVATMLRRQGYTTAAFVSAFPLDARFGLNQGFDTYDDNYGKGEASVDFVVQERRAEATLQAATAWWGAHANGKRFMWVHLYDPHAPYSPPEPFHTQYANDEYLGEIAYVDDALSKAIGPILQADPGALIIVTADHGEALGEHGEKTHGLFAYEPTLKIPLIVAGDGLSHRQVNEYVRHVDIVPTILDVADAQKPKELPGASLLAETIGPRDSYFESLSASINRGWAPLTGIIHDKLKYIDLPLAELYDLPQDPHEQNNERADRRRDAEEARRLLQPMITPAPVRGPVSAEEAASLRALGYVSGNAARKKEYTAADDPKTLIGLDTKMHDAIAAFEHGEMPKAVALSREVVDARPDMDAGRSLYAFMLQQSNMVGQAIAQLQILAHKPDAASDNLVQLALLYSETGHPDAAVDLLAPRAPAGDPDLLNAYGVALSDLGNAEQAAQQFERVLAADPNNAPALQNLGILALKRGDVKTAEANLRRALDLNPRLPLALNTMGVIYAQRGDLANAVDAWARAVEIDPRQFDALYNIGLVELSTGNKAAAKAAFLRFVKHAPQDRYGPDIAAARRTLAQMGSGL